MTGEKVRFYKINPVKIHVSDGLDPAEEIKKSLLPIEWKVLSELYWRQKTNENETSNHEVAFFAGITLDEASKVMGTLGNYMVLYKKSLPGIDKFWASEGLLCGMTTATRVINGQENGQESNHYFLTPILLTHEDYEAHFEEFKKVVCETKVEED